MADPLGTRPARAPGVVPTPAVASSTNVVPPPIPVLVRASEAKRPLGSFMPKDALVKFPIHELTMGARDAVMMDVPDGVTDADARSIAQAVYEILPQATIRANAKLIGLQSEDQIAQYIQTPIDQRAAIKGVVGNFNAQPPWAQAMWGATQALAKPFPNVRGLLSPEHTEAVRAGVEPLVGPFWAQEMTTGFPEAAPRTPTQKVLNFVGGLAGGIGNVMLAAATGGAGAASLVPEVGTLGGVVGGAASREAARQTAIRMAVASGAATGAQVGLTSEGSAKDRLIGAAANAPWFALTGALAAGVPTKGRTGFAYSTKGSWADAKLKELGVDPGEIRAGFTMPSAREAATKGAIYGLGLGAGPTVTAHAIYAATGQPVAWPSGQEWAINIGTMAAFGALEGARAVGRVMPGKTPPEAKGPPQLESDIHGPRGPRNPSYAVEVEPSGAEVLPQEPVVTPPDRQLGGKVRPGPWADNPELRKVFTAGGKGLESATFRNPYDFHMTAAESYLHRFNTLMDDLARNVPPEADRNSAPQQGQPPSGWISHQARIAATVARGQVNAQLILWKSMQEPPPTGPPGLQRERVVRGEQLTRQLNDLLGANPVEITLPGGASFQNATVLKARVIPWAKQQVRLIVRDGATDRVVPIQFPNLEAFRSSLSERGREAVSRTMSTTYNQPGAPPMQRGNILPAPQPPRGLLGPGQPPAPPPAPPVAPKKPSGPKLAQAPVKKKPVAVAPKPKPKPPAPPQKKPSSTVSQLTDRYMGRRVTVGKSEGMAGTQGKVVGVSADPAKGGVDHLLRVLQDNGQSVTVPASSVLKVEPKATPDTKATIKAGMAEVERQQKNLQKKPYASSRPKKSAAEAKKPAEVVAPISEVSSASHKELNAASGARGLAVRSPDGKVWTNGHLMIWMSALQNPATADKYGPVAPKDHSYPNYQQVVDQAIERATVPVFSTDVVLKPDDAISGGQLVLGYWAGNEQKPFGTVSAKLWQHIVKAIGPDFQVDGTEGKDGWHKAFVFKKKGKIAALLMPLVNNDVRSMDISSMQSAADGKKTNLGNYVRGNGNSVKIADMHQSHLINSWKKATKHSIKQKLWDEIAKRGLQDEAVASTKPSEMAIRNEGGKSKVGAEIQNQVITIMSSKSGDLASVSAKEGLQNAIDATRPTGSTGLVTIYTSPQRDYSLPGDQSEEQRWTMITDNGSGMSPTTAHREMMDPGSSLKPEGSTGGYGLAKIPLFFTADNILIVTRNRADNGEIHETIINGSGEEWRNIGMAYHTRVVSPHDLVSPPKDINIPLSMLRFLNEHFADTDAATGTFTRIDYPSATKNPDFRWHTYNRDSYLMDFLKVHRLPMQVRWMRSESPQSVAGVEKYREHSFKPNDYEEVLSSSLTGADVTVYVEKDVAWRDSDSVDLRVLSRGMPQFTQTIGIKTQAMLPPELVVDIKPNVATDSQFYPFDIYRTALMPDATAVVASFVHGLAEKSIAKNAEVMRKALVDAPTFVNMPGIKLVDTSGMAPAELVERIRLNKDIGELMNDIMGAGDDIAQACFSIDDAYNPENFTQAGMGLLPAQLGVNIPGDSSYWTGMDNIILYNPIYHAIEAFERAESAAQRAKDTGLQPFRTQEDLITWMANDMMHTAMHEIVHQKIRSHVAGDGKFEGEELRLLGFPQVQAALNKWREPLKDRIRKAGLYEQLLSFKNDLEALKARQGQGLFGKIGVYRSGRSGSEGDRPGSGGRKEARSGPGVPVRDGAGRSATPGASDTRDVERAAAKRELDKHDSKGEWLDLWDLGHFQSGNQALHVRRVYLHVFRKWKIKPEPALVMDLVGRVFQRAATTARNAELVANAAAGNMDKPGAKELVEQAREAMRYADEQLRFFTASLASHTKLKAKMDANDWAEAIYKAGDEVNKKYGPVTPVDTGGFYLDAFGAGTIAAAAERMFRVGLADVIPKAVARMLRASGKALTSEYWLKGGKVSRRRSIPYISDPWSEMAFYRAFGRRGIGGGGVVLPPHIRQQGLAAEAEYGIRMGAAWEELYRILGTRGLKEFARGSYYGEQLFRYFDKEPNADLPAWVRPLLPKIRALFDHMWEQLMDRMLLLGAKESELPKKISDYIPHLIRGMGSEQFDRFFQQMYAGKRTMSASEIEQIRMRFLLNREGIKDYERDFMTSFRAYVRAYARKMSYDPLVKAVREYGESNEAVLWPQRWGAVRAWGRAYLFPAKSQAEIDMDEDIRVRIFLHFRGAVKEIPLTRAAEITGRDPEQLKAEGFGGFYLVLKGSPVGFSSKVPSVKLGTISHRGRKADVIAVRYGIAYNANIPKLKPHVEKMLAVLGGVQMLGEAASLGALAITSPEGSAMAIGSLLSGAMERASDLRRKIMATGDEKDELRAMEAMRGQEWLDELEANPVGTLSAWVHRRQSLNVIAWNIRSWMVNMSQVNVLTFAEYSLAAFARGTVRYGSVVSRRTYRRYLEVLKERGWLSKEEHDRLNALVPLMGDEVLHVAVGATQGAHQAIEQVLDRIEDAGLSPLDAQVRRLMGPYAGMVIAEANNRGWDLMISMEQALRDGYAPGSVNKIVHAGQKERDNLIDELLEDVRNPKSVAGVAAYGQMMTQFLYNMMGQPNYFASPFGRIFGQLTMYPVSYFLHRELRPLVGAIVYPARGVVKAAKGLRAMVGGGGRGAGVPPRPPGSPPPPPQGQSEPSRKGEPTGFVKHAAGVFWKQMFFSGLLLFLSGKVGLNLMIFGPPTTFILFIGLLHLLFKDNADFEDWFTAAMGVDTQKAFEMSWRGAVWGMSRGSGFVGPTIGMVADAPDKGLLATLKSAVALSIGEYRVETRRLVQLHYESIVAHYGEDFAHLMARATDATYHYPTLTPEQKLALHQGLLPPDVERNARVQIFPSSSGKGAGWTVPNTPAVKSPKLSGSR